MPEVLAPPSAPPGVKLSNPLTAPKAPPAPTREIKLGTPAPTERGPVEPPKPGSARQRASDALYKKAGATPAPSAVTPEPEPVTPPASDTPEPVEAPETPASPETPPATPPAQPTPKGKVNPWKLVDEYKGKVAALEKQVVEAKTTSLPAKEKDEYLGQIKNLSDHNKRLEDEIRYVNYEQSEEFKKTYQEPYEKAFQSAVEEMSELVIEDAKTGARRQVNSQDILNLCNLPLAEARALANELYGDFADDMMSHRKEIRSLFSKRQQALKEAKEKGGERIKQQTELAQKAFQEVSDHIKQTWESVNQSAAADPVYGKFFTPVEGDQDGNQRLAKGYELVDRAFSENPQDPRLSPEQRASVVKRHAAVRNRAAGFGRLRSWYEAALAENADLKKELSQYKGSTPPTGGAPAPEPSPGANGSAWSRASATLRKMAH